MTSNKQASTLVLLFSWLVLLICLITGGSTGVFYYYVQLDCQFLKSSWRLLGFTISLIPFVYWEYKRDKNTFLYSKENILNPEIWATMLWGSLGHTGWTLGLLVSLYYISVAQASLLTNLTPIVVVIYHYSKGVKVSRLELIGTAMSIFGAVILSFDSDVHSRSDMVDISNTTLIDRFIFGVLLGILGSISGAICLTKNQELKDTYPLCLRIMIMVFMGAIQISLASIIFEGATLGFDPKNGVLGLFTKEWLGTYVCIVILTGYGCYFGFVIAVKYFDALLVSLVLTLEPVVGALIVYWLGWQSFPGFLTIIGCFCIIPGIIVVVKGEEAAKKTKRVAQEECKTGIPLLPLSE